MANVNRTLRHHAANKAAKELGYRIEVETITQRLTPLHRAVAYRLDDQPPERKFLCGRLSALEAHEDGVEVLRAIVKDGKPWPGEER